MGRLSNETKSQIVALKEARISINQISVQLGVKRSTVRSVLKKYQKSRSVSNLAVSGRPKKLSNIAVRAMCRGVIKSPKRSLGSITANVTRSIGEPVSSITVRRELHGRKFFGRAAAKKLLLSQPTRAARLAWCRRQLNVLRTSPNFWHTVLFSDEVRFGLSNNGRVWVWRQANERYNLKCTISRSSVRKSIMYWGCISYDGTIALIWCSNSMKAAEYLTVLEEAAIQVATSGFGLTFMDDNAPIHRANVVREWMEVHAVNCLPWPAYSPDLNPIENIWASMKQKIRDGAQITTLDELDAAVRREWANISVATIHKLYDSMKKRLQKCKSAHGYPTKY